LRLFCNLICISLSLSLSLSLCFLSHVRGTMAWMRCRTIAARCTPNASLRLTRQRSRRSNTKPNRY
jgi:hypothetical protein